MLAFQFKPLLRTVTLLLGAMAAMQASAHAQLQCSNPKADSTVVAPKVIHLTFTEGVEESLTKVDLSLAGKPVELDSVVTDPGNKKNLVVMPSMPLRPGVYELKWHAVSVDTHASDGSYKFTIRP